MDLPNIALAAGLAWASGLRLYMVLFLVGVAGYFGWILLPTHLEVLAHPLVLGTSGTLAFSISDLAALLEPIARIASAGGPMNTTPALAHAAAKSAFSDRNP